jgi:class 3 adenylate cyclase
VLNDLSTRLERLDGAAGEERKKTVGEAWLASTGLSDTVAGQTIRAANMAVDLTEALDRFNAHSRYKLKVRIGIDATDGVDGKKVRYEL